MPKFNNKHYDENNNLDKFDIDDFNIDDIDFDDIEDMEDFDDIEDENIDIEAKEDSGNGIDFNHDIEDNKNIDDDLSTLDSNLEEKINNHHNNVSTENFIDDMAKDSLLRNNSISHIDEAKLKNINFKINIEAGSVELSLEELANLKPGDVLDFAGLPPKVKLVLNGSFLAEGYLVEFNGRLGVKLTRLINKEL